MDSVNAALRFQTGEPGFPNAPQTGKPASCFDMLQKGELQGSSALAADWSSISRNELSLIQAALQRAEHPGLPLGDSSLIAAQQFPSDLEPALTAAHPGLPLGGSALTAMAQRQGLGDTEPALIAGQAARQQRVKERESSAAETAPSAALFEAPQKPSAALLQDGYGALGQLSPTTPLLVQISNETCGSSLSPLPSPLNTSLPPPACRTFTLPSLPPVLHPSTALRARCSPGFVPSGFVPSFGTKRRLLAAQIHDLADMEALQQRQAAISSLFRRLQAQSPGSTALHRSVSSELRFEPSQGLSQPQQHPRSSTSLMQPSVQPAAVQPGSFQAHAHKPFPPKSSGLLPCTQQPFSPDSPQIQAAAAAFRSPSAAPRESTPGGNTGFKSPSATPERLEALKAAIPAEVLLRQQGRTGFSNRTQIATLLDAAVGFIEGMREYKLELERQLLAS
ncbi:unnamed protein product [Closterium sp. NIES-65]|nr:unnamed protein product [Closterium sp. NIES-65]CAI6010509.1 unnamed protein product [Closterium sp. NIES-65]